VPRSLCFEFDGGPQVFAPLNEEFAPKTCDVLWSALRSPVTMLATHAMYAGPEIMMDLPESARNFSPDDIPSENQQVVPSPGDVIWYYQAPNRMAGLTDEVWEIGLFYGRGGRVFGPLGWTPCNIVASVEEGLPAFAEACAGLRLTGARNVVLSRVE
jgi:hypothetical protein